MLCSISFWHHLSHSYTKLRFEFLKIAEQGPTTLKRCGRWAGSRKAAVRVVTHCPLRRLFHFPYRRH